MIVFYSENKAIYS